MVKFNYLDKLFFEKNAFIRSKIFFLIDTCFVWIKLWDLIHIQNGYKQAHFYFKVVDIIGRSS